MSKYLDADALKVMCHKEFDEILVWDESGETTANEFCNIVDSLPAADVKEIRYGRWISAPHKRARICSICWCDEPYKFADEEADVYNFCPHCGAYMN